MNAQIAVAGQEASDAARQLFHALVAGERVRPGALGEIAELLERAAHRVRSAGNGMIPPQAVIAEDAAE